MHRRERLRETKAGYVRLRNKSNASKDESQFNSTGPDQARLSWERTFEPGRGWGSAPHLLQVPEAERRPEWHEGLSHGELRIVAARLKPTILNADSPGAWKESRKYLDVKQDAKVKTQSHVDPFPFSRRNARRA